MMLTGGADAARLAGALLAGGGGRMAGIEEDRVRAIVEPLDLSVSPPPPPPHPGLAKLYDDMEGDVEQIFGALGENPGKAIKYPPKDGLEFAEKYLEG